MSRVIVSVRLAIPLSHGIDATNMHHPIIVPESPQQFVTKFKKGVLRQAIVLEDNSFRLVLEKPVYGHSNALVRSQMVVAIPGLYVTRPVHPLLNRTRLVARFPGRSVLRIRPVSRDIQPGRPGTAYALKDPLGRFRAVIYNEQNRTFQTTGCYLIAVNHQKWADLTPYPMTAVSEACDICH